MGTPLQNPLLKRAVNNNARCSILSGRGGEDNQDEEVEKVTYSAKLKGAETREEVEDLLKAVADNKNCLVCLFSNRVFTQHRNLTAHYRVSCRAVKASLGQFLSGSGSSSVAQEPANGIMPR